MGVVFIYTVIKVGLVVELMNELCGFFVPPSFRPTEICMLMVCCPGRGQSVFRVAVQGRWLLRLFQVSSLVGMWPGVCCR